MSLDESLYEGVLESAQEAAEKIRSLIDEDKLFTIFCHNDADGLAAGAIASIMLLRESARFSTRSVTNIDEILNGVKDLPEGSVIILTDIGSGYLDELSKRVEDRVLIVLDHHAPVKAESKNLVHVNPHLHGVNGADEVSGAGVTYLVAKSLNHQNITSSPIAVVGALGDMQDRVDGRSLHGLNELIVEDAVKSGLIKVEEDLLFYGRSYKPIHVAMASTMNPFIPGISGNESQAYSFLTRIGIKVKEDERWRVLAELDEDERKKLYNGLIRHLASLGASPSIARELIGKVYELIREEPWTYLRDAREFASLLNACGKTDNDWIGIAIAMGERGSLLEDAHNILEKYRAMIAEAMEHAMSEENRQELRSIVVIDGGEVINDRLISSIATMIMSSGVIGEDKILVAVASTQDSVKVSARASRKLVEKGIDLGEIIGKAAKLVKGRGGGHDIAAGAEIPKVKKALFIMEVDRIAGEALRSS